MHSDALLGQVAEWLRESQTAVAFTGAGMSTESGIPDFRSPGGVWATHRPVYFDDFLARPEARFEYWRQKALTHHQFVRSRPNRGHQILAEWEAQGRLRGIITQNIEELHQAAGSQNVLELHGTAMWVACLDCGSRFEAGPWVEYFEQHQRVPDCPECGGLLKHATISFGQALDAETIHSAAKWSQEADLFLAIGSSLVVEPAASFPRIAKKHQARLVIINRDPTPLDRWADIVLNAEIGPTLQAIHAKLTELQRSRPSKESGKQGTSE